MIAGLILILFSAISLISAGFMFRKNSGKNRGALVSKVLYIIAHAVMLVMGLSLTLHGTLQLWVVIVVLVITITVRTWYGYVMKMSRLHIHLVMNFVASLIIVFLTYMKW